MIEGNQYIEIVKTYFKFLIIEFDFKFSEEIITGNYFYRVRYINKEKAVTVSYENIENYLSVFISLLQNGELPDYDDKTKTLHLNKLNAQLISSIDRNEIDLNDDYFVKFNPKTEIEKQLLKSAKELRLCLKLLKVMYQI